MPSHREDAPGPAMRVSVNLLDRALKYRGFALHVGVFVEWNRSTISIHDYRNRGGAFGVSKTF